MAAGLSAWAAMTRLAVEEPGAGFSIVLSAVTTMVVTVLAVRWHPMWRHVAVFVLLGGMLGGTALGFSIFAIGTERPKVFPVAALWWVVTVVFIRLLLKQLPDPSEPSNKELWARIRSHHDSKGLEALTERLPSMTPVERYEAWTSLDAEAKQVSHDLQTLQSRQGKAWPFFTLQMTIMVMFSFSFSWVR